MPIHKDAKPFKTKLFPFYDDLYIIFGKDRVTGINAETLVDAVEQLKNKEEADLDKQNLENNDTMMGTNEV